MHALVSTFAKGRRIEMYVPVGFALVGLLVAVIVAPFTEPGSDWFPAVAAVIVAVVALLHIVLLVRAAVPAVFPRIIAGIGAVSAAGALEFTAWRLDDPDFLRIAPPLAATVIALALERLARRVPAAGATVVGAWTAAVVAAAALIPAVLTALQQLLAVIANAVTRTTELVSLPDGRVAAISAIATVTALATLVWAVTGRLVPRAVPIATSIAAAAILGVALLPAPWGVMAGWFVIAAAGIVALILTKRAVLSVLTRLARRAGLRVRSQPAARLGLEGAAGWGSAQPTWQVASIVSVVLLLVARLAIVDATARAGLLATSIAVAAFGMGALALDRRLGGCRALPHGVRCRGARCGRAAARQGAHHARSSRRVLGLPITILSALAGWVALTVFVANDGLFAGSPV